MRWRSYSALVILFVGFSFCAWTDPVQAQTVEFRGFWADVFHEGYKSTAEVDALISRAVAGRYNVILPEMMAYQDNTVASHGAYWRSNILPRSSVVTTSFDPLAYLIERAHANGIQVHPWLVAFRVSSAWPPAGNSFLASHPEYMMVPLASMGSVAPVGSDYVLDPGSPEVQEYLVSIVRELATNYAIDGIHWDYIRYTQADAGYPTNTSYANSSLARFKRLTGYTGTPPATGNTSWDDFRRRSITEIIRRVRAEVASITTNPQQPLRHSASLITWGSAPSTFSGSSAWARFQNWEEWMRLGYLDTGIPMTYYDYSVYPTYYTSWVNKEIAWRYQRQMVVGPGIYLNTFADSLTELNYARNAGADGVSTYSYWATKKSSANDWTWYNYIATNFFTTTASVPTMPWRDPATATEGTLWGRVTDSSTGLPVEDASVQVGSMAAVKTDANGYYVVTLIAAGAAGTNYTVTVTKSGYPTSTHESVQVIAGSLSHDDYALGATTPPPAVTEQPQPQSACGGGGVTFAVAATGAGILTYQWQKNSVNLVDGGHYSGATTETLSIASVDSSDVASYRCVVSNEGGSTNSNAAALTLKTATAITQQPAAQNVCAGATATFAVTAAGDGTLAYLWHKNGVALTDGGHYAGATTATLAISSADAEDVASYHCVVTAGCGTAVSADAALAFKTVTNITQDPASLTVDHGATAQFTAVAAGDGALSYQWQKNGVNLTEGGHYSGVGTVTLTISDADSNDAASYRCVATGDCGSAASAEATLTVNLAPGILAVTPVGGLNSSGNVGGPFTPSSITYTLSNTGDAAIDWTVGKTQSWVTLSKLSGTLAAGATDTLIVSINSAANSLAAGSYADTVTFSNATNGNGNTTRSVALTVNASPGVLSVTPTTGLSSSGVRGGPFTPSSITYTLTNTGGSPINYTIAKTKTWVTLSKTSGTLAAGASTTVVVSINSGANTLKVGTYTDTVTFTNTTNGSGNTTRSVTLSVKRR